MALRPRLYSNRKEHKAQAEAEVFCVWCSKWFFESGVIETLWLKW